MYLFKIQQIVKGYDNIKILAVDQSRTGGWAIFDYKTRILIKYGYFDFPSRKYTFPQAIVQLKALIDNIVKTEEITAVFIEDINLRQNVQAFKNLAQLQGVLENYFEENQLLYGIIAPTQWQNFCGARGRTDKEKKSKIVTVNTEGKKKSKILSITYIHDKFKVDTSNDGIADAICIGDYVCNNIKIETKGDFVNGKKEN